MSEFDDGVDSAEGETEVDGLDPRDANRIDGGGATAVLTYLAKELVDDPESVRVDVEAGRGKSISLRLTVNPEDMGKVIGKRGRVAQAIRTVVRAAAAKDGIDAQVDIVD